MNKDDYKDLIIIEGFIVYNGPTTKEIPILESESVFYVWKESLNAATTILISSEQPMSASPIKVVIGIFQSEFSKTIKKGETLFWGGLQKELGTLLIKRIFPPTIEMQLPKLEVVTLYRPVNQEELNLIKESDYTRFPPRKIEQPIFYPVLYESYASKIAKEWNAEAYGVGYVTQFDVRKDYLLTYEIHNVGGNEIDEYWIPSEDLELFNICIVGKIKVIKTFYREN
ncbi:hypothetical protein LAG90_09210 [Marinilongibacter aquaticus]|uniref:hypothetical protein n=1 Tax=Marinilongibacter aquaticus TaxID=2975157 RepID=UPI0021BD6F22|nr:hypothetical protein [Marinilongibacter aquaticus]UBM60813.1 hypothetical protein LAG90_09210 [Marinilongibacter aquaticus]